MSVEDKAEDPSEPVDGLHDDAPQGDAVYDDALLDHEYDGIQEFDNPMPRWWTRMYWGSFLFSLGYLFHYWVGNGVSTEDDFKAEMEIVHAARAKEALNQSVSEQSLSQVMAASSSVQAGAELYQAKCSPCHLEKGQGSIGPNLTDDAWIHGDGSLMGIYKTVSEGANNGMPAWNRQLKPDELRQVVAYVGTLRGTNIKGKEAEGTVTGVKATE